jgi:hypothetical protein
MQGEYIYLVKPELLKRTLLTLLFSSLCILSFSQTILDTPIVIAERTELSFLFRTLEEKYAVRFFFIEDWLKHVEVDPSLSGQSLKEILDTTFKGTDLSYTFLFNYAVVLTKDPAPEIQRESLLQAAAASRKQILPLVIGDRLKDFVPGRSVTLRGVVSSETDGGKMQGVTVLISDMNVSTTTDEGGNYSLSMPAGKHVVQFQHLNFAEKVIDLEIYKTGSFNPILEERPTILSEVEVSDQAIVSSRISQTSLQITDLKRAPTFLGEADVIKSLQIQSGVTTVGEVASGFNVRGGGVDQNLVLYDGVPVFNTSHALGFFTAFNSESINKVSFYRGGIPAEFGGRASSVLNITSREGNYRKWGASGGIGIISSHLTVGGPLKPDTTSIILSARSSYSNWMLRAVQSNYRDLTNSGMAFYDGSLKLAHMLSSKTKLTISGYTSHDDFTLADDTLYSWNNMTGSVRLDHSHNSRLFSSYMLGLGQYKYKFSEEDPENAFDLNFGMIYPSFNADFNYNGAHALSFGIHNTFYEFTPGKLERTSDESTVANISLEKDKALETALYISDAFTWRENVFIEAGLRYSVYNCIGPATIYEYSPGRPYEEYNTVDSSNVSGVYKTWHGAEPRLSLRYTIDPNSSVKLGYNRIFQYLHLITNTAAVTPIDVWQSSNSFFRPQIADQLSIGYYRNLKGNMLDAFIEGYYKTTQNILEFKDGAELVLNDRLETALINGRALSYGVEFSLAKVRGRLQGFVNYTYSRSFREVNGAHASEKVNQGERYSSNFDQPNVANLSWRYGISRRHFFSGNFTYHTGRPISVPRSAYSVDGVPVADFSDRNGSRIPDYHRLDLAFIIEGNHKLKKLWDGTWVISFYNVYARKNAYSVFFQRDDDGALVPYKLSIIGTIIPSVSYTFKL